MEYTSHRDSPRRGRRLAVLADFRHVSLWALRREPGTVLLFHTLSAPWFVRHQKLHSAPGAVENVSFKSSLASLYHELSPSVDEMPPCGLRPAVPGCRKPYGARPVCRLQRLEPSVLPFPVWP
jgi:hypothetical protein